MLGNTAIDAIQYLINTAVTAATDAGSRIYPSIAPQSAAYPLVILQIVSRETTPTQPLGSAVDIYRIQADVFAKPSGTTSAFLKAHTIDNALRTAWSRTSDGQNYSTGIDLVQEDDSRSDWFPEEQVYNVSTDYFIRMKQAGDQVVPASDFTETESIWAGHLWFGEIIYTKTFTFLSGNDDWNDLDDLLVADVELILPFSVQRSDEDADGAITGGVDIKLNGTGGYKVFLSATLSTIYLTLFYTK